jgi:Heterokaryon incompatibility protein (HET)
LADLADTQSSATLDMINSWINTCEADHENCRAEYHHREDWLPTRLIDVGDNDQTATPRLCDASKLPRDTRYFALSHCWGTQPITTLLTANYEAFKQALPLSDLQQTFVDAINLTRRLQIKYLWIDSLCIVQDSTTDWESEALAMGDVYANAFCTIAATGFPDGNNGLLTKRDPDLVPPIRFTVSSNALPQHGLPSGSYYCFNDFWQEGVVEAPLSQRAWCFQERCLSRRIVHFGPRQVLWECMDTEKCDIFPNILPATFRTKYKQENAFTKVDLKLHSGLRISAWFDTVNEYTAGSLTYEYDKLAAIAGLASKQIWTRPYRYWAGLWDCGFHYNLLWEGISCAILVMGIRRRDHQLPR